MKEGKLTHYDVLKGLEGVVIECKKDIGLWICKGNPLTFSDIDGEVKRLRRLGWHIFYSIELNGEIVQPGHWYNIDDRSKVKYIVTIYNYRKTGQREQIARILFERREKVLDLIKELNQEEFYQA